ncbi:hypothetical protein RND71_016958 [Anisodus tanguticus]|uniref:Uncharacterized protein n=1 Tax=Anisodus tanguticus TaxID=243964 RepID=A0AAE1VAK2_9SOLA|nr:hypothetical protein RND71_016958 [Anisodus tanguticus]
MAAERVGLKETPKALENSSVNLNVSYLFNFKTSEVGPQLLKAMSEAKFEGLSGKFHLVYGKMESSSYQIINVVGNRQKEGWEVPMSGKKLKIGVPVKSGFTDFVRVTRDGQANGRMSGFYIDVFKSVMEALPYAVPYELV